jgi:parallel beta-helix repeat protein
MILDCHPRIVNNLIVGNTGGAIFSNSSRPELIHNTIADNLKNGQTQGIQAMSNSRVSITDTIFYQSRIDILDPDFSRVTVSYSFLDSGYGIPWPGKGNIAGNPLFIGDGNYHLQPGSPCQDSGRNAGISIDLDGNKRPKIFGFDMGAYEVGFSLSDLVVCLQVCAGMALPPYANVDFINGLDDQIGLEDATFILQSLAEIR